MSSRLLQKKFPEPLSFCWRLNHATLYLIGGITFLIGSYEFTPGQEKYVLGGWLFTIGSTTFLLADISEWWKNNRVGCFLYSDFEASYERQYSKYMRPRETLLGMYDRAENGLNFFLSVTGSFLYLLGSIYLLPYKYYSSYNSTVVYIYGSLAIFLSQAWKLYRAGKYNSQFPMERRFSCGNWDQDMPGFFVDLFACLGGLFYFLGSVLFLPQYDLIDEITSIASGIYVLGGACFFLSGLSILVRYFDSSNSNFDDSDREDVNCRRYLLAPA